jgi:hypothetical protein
MIISEKNRSLIERVLETVDWATIFKFYKLVKRKIGLEAAGIPGIKKLKSGEKLSPDHIKEEVKCLLHHVVENDLSQFVYGPWYILWVNGEWEVEIEKEDESDEPTFLPILESVLELSFSPMVVISKENLIFEEIQNNFDDLNRETLNERLEKAVDEENYELASEIKNLIEIQEKQNGKKSN